MTHKTSRSTYVRVALSPDTELNHELQNAPNRAARLLELATMGLALKRAALAAQFNRSPVPSSGLTMARPTPDGPPVCAERIHPLDDDLIRIWTQL